MLSTPSPGRLVLEAGVEDDMDGREEFPGAEDDDAILDEDEPPADDEGAMDVGALEDCSDVLEPSDDPPELLPDSALLDVNVPEELEDFSDVGAGTSASCGTSS